MADLKINTLVTSVTPIPASDVDLVALVRAVNAFHATVPLSKFHVKQTATPGRFSYAFDAVDGRAWDQVLDFNANPADPSMTFAVADFWKLSEFSFQRPIRDLVVKLVPLFGVTEIKFTFPA